MAEAKTFPIVTLVAVERGFALGRLIEPGEKFEFDTTPPEPVGGVKPKLAADGSRRLPKWAALPGDARLSKPKPKVGDLKPKAAQAAVKQKAGALSGASEPVA